MKLYVGIVTLLLCALLGCFGQELVSQSARDHIECIDGSMCMKGETCCKTPTEKYSCCSIPDAICCADGKHCCPSGTKCDLSTGNCPPSNARIPWLKKTMTSRLYQKRQKQNLDKKLRFIPDNHGPYKKPAEDAGFI